MVTTITSQCMLQRTFHIECILHFQCESRKSTYSKLELTFVWLHQGIMHD